MRVEPGALTTLGIRPENLAMKVDPSAAIASARERRGARRRFDVNVAACILGFFRSLILVKSDEVGFGTCCPVHASMEGRI